MDVHGPYIPPPSYDGHFAGRPLEQRWGSKIDVGALESNVTAGPDVLRGWIDRYDESLLYLDEQVGHLLDELARRGVLDNTIVIFTSIMAKVSASTISSITAIACTRSRSGFRSSSASRPGYPRASATRSRSLSSRSRGSLLNWWGSRTRRSPDDRSVASRRRKSRKWPCRR